MWVASGDDLQNCRDISHIGSQRPNAIQRRRKRNQPIPGNASVTAHHRGNPAKRSRLADRSARVRSQRRHRQPRRNGRRRTPARTAWYTIRRHGVLYRSVSGVLVRTAHRKFVAVRFTENDRAGRFQPFYGCCVKGRNMIFENPRPASRFNAACADHVLDRHGHARKRRQRLSRSHQRINLVRLPPSALR